MSKDNISKFLESKVKQKLSIDDLDKKIEKIDLIGKSDKIIDNAKSYIGLYLLRVGVYITIIIGIVLSMIAFITILPVLAWMIFTIGLLALGIVIIVAITDIIGSTVAMSKSIYNNVGLIAYDGLWKFFIRIVVAWTMSWKYVFMKIETTEVKKIS
jgi:hypothetical protein